MAKSGVNGVKLEAHLNSDVILCVKKYYRKIPEMYIANSKHDTNFT